MLKILFATVFAALLLFSCNNKQPATPLQSNAFIPKGYEIRDSIGGYLNPDTIPDLILVLDTVTQAMGARRLLVLLYGQPGGGFSEALHSDKIIYSRDMGGASSDDPYVETTTGKGVFSVRHSGGMPSWGWDYTTRFRLHDVDSQWYLDRTNFESYNPEDTIPMAVTHNVEVQDAGDFGKVVLTDFDIFTFEAHQEDTIETDNRFVHASFSKNRTLQLPAKDGELDSIAVLKALFPGRFLRDFDEMEDANVVFWLCEDCPKVVLPSYTLFIDDQPEKIIWPDKWANFTKIAGVLTYVEQGATHKAVFFSTSNDFPPSGHFSAGILGIADFTKNEDKWELTTFSPHLIAEGDYNTAHAPQKVIEYGDYHFFELDGGNANFNGSTFYYSEKFLFGIKNSLPVLFLHEADGACNFNGIGNGQTSWNTIVEPFGPNHHFPGLKLIATGHFRKYSDEQTLWNEISWLKLLQQQHPGQDSFDFKVTRSYRFNGKKYVQTMTQFE